jgi:hypothetical protein
MRTEFGLERTVCGCEVCKTNCRNMPGFLIPTDLARMIPAGIDPLTWAETNLLASPGALVMKGAQLFRIPTLVPSTKSDGSCINLTAEGLCSIHENAPFGCAFFDCGPERNQLSHSGLTAVYASIFDSMNASLYRQLWLHLSERGLVQQRAEVLREKMRKELP